MRTFSLVAILALLFGTSVGEIFPINEGYTAKCGARKYDSIDFRSTSQAARNFRKGQYDFCSTEASLQLSSYPKPYADGKTNSYFWFPIIKGSYFPQKAAGIDHVLVSADNYDIMNVMMIEGSVKTLCTIKKVRYWVQETLRAFHRHLGE